MRKIENDLDLFQKEITDANFVILNKNITDKMKWILEIIWKCVMNMKLSVIIS